MLLVLVSYSLNSTGIETVKTDVYRQMQMQLTKPLVFSVSILLASELKSCGYTNVDLLQVHSARF